MTGLRRLSRRSSLRTFYEPEDERIARFEAQEDGVTFLAYFLLSPGQEPELTPAD